MSDDSRETIVTIQRDAHRTELATIRAELAAESARRRAAEAERDRLAAELPTLRAQCEDRQSTYLELMSECQKWMAAERKLAMLAVPTPEFVQEIAVATRRNRFVRTRRVKSFDESVLPTEQETDDATAAIRAISAVLEASND